MFDFMPQTTVPQETEPSLEGLLRFCESRPADEEYGWLEPDSCLIGQYLKHLGQFKWGIYGQTTQALGLDKGEGLYVHYAHPHTFGAAASRCRAYLHERAS
jgi:hypothetical protein